jgi:hypothetical protein
LEERKGVGGFSLCLATGLRRSDLLSGWKGVMKGEVHEEGGRRGEYLDGNEVNDLRAILDVLVLSVHSHIEVVEIPSNSDETDSYRQVF